MDTSKEKSKKRKYTRKSKLPIIPCVECDGNLYPLEITFICEKCQSIVPVNTEHVCKHIVFTKEDSEHIKKYIQTYLKRKSILENKALSKFMEENENSLEYSFSGKQLTALKIIKEKFKVDSFSLIINVLIRNFLFIIKCLDKLDGDEVYLCDNKDNKTQDVRKQLIKNFETEYNNYRDAQDVEEFLKIIYNDINISKIRKKGKNE